MKSVRMTLGLILIAGLNAVASVAQASPQMEMSCSFVRYYNSPKGDGSVDSENLVPKTVKPVKIKVESIGGQQIKGAKIEFSTKTPDGIMKMSAFATAVELPGNEWISVTMMTSIVFVRHGIIFKPAEALETTNFRSAENLSEPLAQVISFATGPKPDDTITNDYRAECSVSPVAAQ